MKSVWVILVWGCCATSVAVAAKLPPLPKWNSADKEKIRKGKMVVGMALLTKDGLKKEEEKPSNAAEVIIEAVEEKPSLEKDKKLAENSEISGEYLERYFGKEPTESLIDPQQLLSMQERADLKYALQLHEEDSEVPIYVYLFDSGQKVPKDYDPQSMYDKVFKEKEQPVVIVYYYIGAPEKSDFLLAGGLSSQIPVGQVRELLYNAGLKARERSDLFDQLDVYVGQLSMRLFWIEEILSDLVQDGLEVVVNGESIPKSNKAKELVGTLEENVSPYAKNILHAAVGLLVLASGVLLYVMKRRYRFPENPTTDRLGGHVGARSGGIMSYRNAKQPPSEQRKQFKNDFF